MEKNKWIGVLGTSGKVYAQKFVGQDLGNNISVLDSTDPYVAEDKEDAQKKAERRLESSF